MNGARRWFVSLLLVIVLQTGSLAWAHTPPSIRFDASSAVECRDVTPPEMAESTPGEKLIEARFRVSVLLTEGREQDVEDLMIVIESPEKRLRTMDFCPKTEVGSDVEGQIQTVQTHENGNTKQAKLGGSVATLHALADAELQTTEKQTTAKTYKQLPNKYLVLASGTTHGEHGVFFKIKASPQASLEGAKEFTCVFVVPASWRADWCRLSCQARTTHKQFLGSSKLESCGQADFYVGLYLAGDEFGKIMARRVDQVQAFAQPNQPAKSSSSASAKGLEFVTVITAWARPAEPQRPEISPREAALAETLQSIGRLSGNEPSRVVARRRVPSMSSSAALRP
jgi:hypothetical protein